MRLTSRMWIDATLRRCTSEGKFGAVITRGADEAGAVYVYVNHLNGTYDLLVPPPGPSHNEDGERHFAKIFSDHVDWEKASAFVAKQRRHDSDIWAIEIEDREGLGGLLLVSE